MSLQTWQELLVWQFVQGSAFASFTTAKTVIPASSLVTVPQGYFYIGRGLRVTVDGALSNIVTTPGTVTFQVMLGTVVVFTTGAIQLNATAHTKLPFRAEFNLTCRAVGSGTSANFMGQGVVMGKMFTNTAAQVDGVNTDTILMVPATAPAVGTGFDSTAAQTIDFFTGFSISDAANLVQIEQYRVESLN